METERGGLKGLRPLPECPIEPSRLALFLDLDGTLAPFEATPDLVGPDPQRTHLLRAVGQRLSGRLAILSGRTLRDIDRIVADAVAAAAGVHGLERRSAQGVRTAHAAHPALDHVEGSLQAFADHRPGLLVERKPQSVALHYRNDPALGGDAVALTTRLAARWGLTMQNGQMVTELRTPGDNKGDALKAFMTEPPFLGARPLMLGDDLTDEPAFVAAASLNGYGVLVGSPRPTAASFHLPDVASVLDWLEGLSHADADLALSEEGEPWRA